MIAIETITKNGQAFRRTHSDTYKIRKVGTSEVYTEAVDLLTASWEYEETDIPLPENDISDSEALAILTGGKYDKKTGYPFAYPD